MRKCFNSKKQTNKRFSKVLTGFTLIELIVVIAIIAVLAAVVAPNAYKAIEKAKISRAIQDMKTIKTAALSYYADTGTWPLRHQGGTVRASGKGFLINDDGTNHPGAGSLVIGWDGPYLDKWPDNPWGNPASFFNNKYYWDADDVGDDNNNGIQPEASVIIFNMPLKSALILDHQIDDGILSSGFVSINTSVVAITANPTTLNLIIYEPI